MIHSQPATDGAAIQLVLPDCGQTPNFQTGSIFFVGNATTIIRYGGFTILTDPNFLHQGEHVHLGYGLRSARRTNPAVELEDLPPIDFVALSHMHEDHFDRVVEQKLDKELPIITTHEAARKLAQKGFRAAYGLQHWEKRTLVKGSAHLQLTAMPGRHGPPFLASLLPCVNGSLLEFQLPDDRPPFRLYISGDTLMHQPLEEIPKRYPDIDLALIHLGGTKILGVLLTMDAEQGIQAIQLIAPRVAIPIHFNDYTIMKSPLSDFVRAAEAARLKTQIQVLEHGDEYTFEVPFYKE
ncbi:MBL fold metallo-hydrolase [Nodosilinea sp. LEGE 06152]|uniref:MBL fold metallo-hydrolase n=1 Tax=Nodosilinea sp. LEGE 06152 TaxID=2777966 RepID=UPI00187EEDC7|nr:MBL fold metallo-hydrolase [Nodosilinea sp. LEGE 06152]MBE9158084.1 MBL fold metallo-hydrolase [Nodosilinea sp. LEGE 06152]